MTTSQPSVAFENLIQQFITYLCKKDPVEATYLGVVGFDHILADMSKATMLNEPHEVQGWIDKFRAFRNTQLNADEQIDRDLALAKLREQKSLSGWKQWEINPGVYLASTDGVLAIFLTGLRPEVDMVHDAIFRLNAIPIMLAQAQKNLTPQRTDPILVERALSQATEMAGFCEQDLFDMVEDPVQRDLLRPAAAKAAAAYRSYADFLTELKPLSRGTFVLGEKRYTAVLRQGELLDIDARQLRELGKQQVAILTEELQSMALQILGTPDWKGAIAKLQQDHPATLEGMRSEYEQSMLQARAFIYDRQLASDQPGEVCSVEPAPRAWRAVLGVACYVAPPMFKPSLRGRFFVPYPVDMNDAETTKAILEDNSRYLIPSTAVHEGYPGHHWHLMTVANARPLRRILGSTYFTEGWGLYTEQMMREEGFYTDPKAIFGQVQMRLFRAARIVVDTSLHLGEMTFDAAVTYMQDHACLPPEIAKAEVIRYCDDPTQASAYLTGSLQLQEMWKEYHLQTGKSRKSFHDSLAHSGMMPIGLAARAIGIRPNVARPTAVLEP